MILGGLSTSNNHINLVVIKDVPDNCVVSGVPAKIIKQDGKKVL